MRPNHPAPAYETIHEFRTRFNHIEVRFYSKLGLPEWDQITPASILIAENIHLSPDRRVLLLGCGHGALGAALARQIPQGEIWLADHNQIALDMSRRTLQANSLENAHLLEEIFLPADLEGSFDIVVMLLPKGRKLAQRWLLEAAAALRVGGLFYLAGPNDLGIQPAIRDAEVVFGKAAVLGYKKGNRAVRLVKPEADHAPPSWASLPGISRRTWYELQVEVFGESLHLHSLPGVFSYDRLDDGSRLLIERLEIQPGEKVLDLGCGYGILGILAVQAGADQVDLVDANLLAAASTRENVSLLQLQKAQVMASDAASAVLDRRYSLVITNPPFHTGKAVGYDTAHAFITQAHHVLQPGGRLLLVANRFLRYETLINQVFRKVDRVAETGKYQVFVAERN